MKAKQSIILRLGFLARGHPNDPGPTGTREGLPLRGTGKILLLLQSHLD
jgi:hypothetical protein